MTLLKILDNVSVFIFYNWANYNLPCSFHCCLCSPGTSAFINKGLVGHAFGPSIYMRMSRSSTFFMELF